jgi:lipoic acid synthetase
MLVKEEHCKRGSAIDDRSPERPGRRLPPWLKKRMPAGDAWSDTARTVKSSRIATVCQEARCPNRAECWSQRVVTFMIMGDTCTRSCAFCSVKHGSPKAPDPNEPRRLAEATARLGARHVVITSVTRDDLPDEGAGHFAECVLALREALAGRTVEVLPADMHARQECIETICSARPAVYGHNLETVESLTPRVRPQADYRRSLDVLQTVKRVHPEIRTKSGLLLGMGEGFSEIEAALSDLRRVGCDMVAIGQYLQPAPDRWPVAKYWSPEEFDEIGSLARAMGFGSVLSGPFVRSSYSAAGAFAELRQT